MKKRSFCICFKHYNLEGVAKVIDDLFKKYQYRQLETEINTPVAILEIKNLGAKKITLDRDLANLLGINRVLDLETHVKNLRYPTTYFIHCNVIDKNQNFLNNKKSDVLAKLDLKAVLMKK